MTDLIKQWIQDRLGIFVDTSSEVFAETVKDGYLLSEILNNYNIITEDQLKTIQKSNFPGTCIENFQQHINIWLESLEIYLTDEEIFEIANAKGTTALNLFYQVYLELQGKNKLNVIYNQRFNEKSRPQNIRFAVQSVKQSLLDDLPSASNIYATPIEEAHDIIHWKQDRLDKIISKCKEARSDYFHYIKSQERTFSMQSMCANFKDEEKPSILRKPDLKLREETIDLNYEELINEQKKAKDMVSFVPDPEKCKKILTKLHIKQLKHAENLIYKSEIQREILSSMWNQVKDDDEDEFSKNITETLLTQSLYEKQMLQKLGEVKLQKQIIIDNKQIISDAICKQKEEDFVQNLILKDKELNEQELSYYFEKDRIIRLHSVIYQEKLRLKAERNYNMCLEYVNDLIDLSLKEVEYKKMYGEEPSKRIKESWKNMFITKLSLEDNVKPLVDIVKYPEELSGYEEEIIHQEIERQNKIDKQEFDDYLNFDWPWELKNIDIDDEILNEMTCGLNILGYLVHNLLLKKYPQLPFQPETDLPIAEIKVCVSGLIDTSWLPILQKILSQREVIVVEIENVINFCINAYKEETKVEDEEENIEEVYDTKKKKTNTKKESKPKKGAKSSKSKVTKDVVEEPLTEEIEKADKKIQTPKIFPMDEIELTQRAELGKIAEAQLALGEPLTDHLLVDMFVEYLKAQKNIKGWVLINYPDTFEQAALLEERLTGLLIPGMSTKIKTPKSIYELADIEIRSIAETSDELEECRKSKILPNPGAKLEEEDIEYKTVLTAFIRILKLDDEETSTGELPPLIEVLERDASPLDQFYADMGCNYFLYYNKFDFSTIKYLAKLVIGDYSLPLKSSIELFGDTMNYIDDALNDEKLKTGVKSIKKETKKEKPKKKIFVKKSEKGDAENKNVKENVKGKKSKTKIVIVRVDKYTQIPEVEEEIEIIEELEEPPKPGEPGWVYTNLPIPDEFLFALTTCWENAEEVYVDDFCQVLFMKRIILNAVMPFVNFVKIHMDDFIKRPDTKQVYLREFQKTYNEFDDDFRSDVEFKAELHCRIEEMKEKLINLCDNRMMEAEEKRCDIIRQNWAPRQFIQLINNYICAFQLEVDRFVDSIEVMNDYYAAVVTKMPDEEILAKELLPKWDIDDTKISTAVNYVLENVDNESDSINIIFSKIDELFQKLLGFANKTSNVAYSILEKIKALIIPDGKKGKDKKKDKSPKKGEKNILKIFEPDRIVKENSDKIFEEWTCAIKGEMARVTIRLNLLKLDLRTNLDEIISTIQKSFHNIFNDIRLRYQKEVDSVTKACEVLARAVEEEVKIEEVIYFEDDNFFIDPESILFPIKIPVAEPVVEYPIDSGFKISQLDKLIDIFLDLAPSGYIPERCFIYLLQDLITVADGPVLLPENWYKLKSHDVNKIVGELFDNIEYIQWKDFIIYNLMLRFPNQDEIINMRNLFRSLEQNCAELVTDDNFFSTKLWFETIEADGFRVKELKNLILKLYRVQNDINYTAMLLDFCKDESLITGFAKALSLSLGKSVCFDKDIGQQFVEETLKRRKEHEEIVRKRNEERQNAIITVQGILGNLVDHTVHTCDSIVFEDLNPPDDYNVNEISNNIQEIIPNDEEKPDLSNEEKPDLSNEEKAAVVSNEENEVEEEEEKSVDSFSNIEINFEVEAGPPLAYFLPFDVLLTVVTTSLPWHARVENIEDKSFRELVEEIYNKCKSSEFNFQVLSHEFLNNPDFIQILEKTSKFLAKNPVEVVENILRKNENKKD